MMTPVFTVLVAPTAPVATVSTDGTTLTGTGEAGATVQVTNAGGQPIGTATVGADGSYTIALPTGTADGRPLTVTQADAAGNVSPATSAATPDLVAPTAPTAILGADGLTLSGTGEAGATVEIRAADGSLLGSATVAGDGSYSAKLTGPQANGETLTVTQTDAAGEQRLDEIRQSVTEEIDLPGEGEEPPPPPPGTNPPGISRGDTSSACSICPGRRSCAATRTVCAV